MTMPDLSIGIIPESDRGCSVHGAWYIHCVAVTNDNIRNLENSLVKNNELRGKDMEQESELQRLEKFVEKILTRFSALKAEKTQLEQEVFERDLLIEELRENISSKVTERIEISERVNKIVDQIEEWELNLDIGKEETENDSSEEVNPEVDFLSEESQEPEEENGDENERHVQHDLFSMTHSKE
jgi:predicted RNase H-like nuclease (RuvC/YqgF family)